MRRSSRTEAEVLQELEDLVSSAGYVHAIAFVCFRDNFVSVSGDADPKEFAKLYSSTRLIRTEISTLIGLALKHPINWDTPSPEQLEHYIQRTETLLEELHGALNEPMFKALQKAARGDRDEGAFASGTMLREPVFYGAESAYGFQYRDLSVEKYAHDRDWLTAAKGFTIDEAKKVVEVSAELTTDKLREHLILLASTDPSDWTMLPSFELTAGEIASRAELPIEMVERVLIAFSVPDSPGNEQFQQLNDFNAYNAAPIIRRSNGNYICFQHSSLLEALYESPFFWMLKDPSYKDQATANRGAFLERLSHRLLVRVFGEQRVFSNVLILDKQGNREGEIDTLVIFGSRAIVVQAKSKRMTIEARKGNDQMLKTDFAKSVQASYDQGFRCAELLRQPQRYKFIISATGEALEIGRIDKTFVFCLLSDHYPALSAQARELLRFQRTEHIPAPFVMDVFLLDAMTEMLRSPLHFLSYVDRRVNYNDRVLASHELTILSYHLKQNLWVDRKFNLFQLGDDVSTDLDMAMLVRRDGLQGADTPDGILTRFKDTTFERLILQINQDPRDNAVDLGLLLLSLNQDAATRVSDAIDLLSAQARGDGQAHDFTIGSSEGGLTIHISDLPIAEAEARLRRHCVAKKYQQHAKRWIGVLLSPVNSEIRAIGKLDFKWTQDKALERSIAAVPGTRRFTKPIGEDGKKLGRNDPCPCGSGKKFKRCCS